jgi:hypothetical protein
MDVPHRACRGGFSGTEIEGVDIGRLRSDVARSRLDKELSRRMERSLTLIAANHTPRVDSASMWGATMKTAQKVRTVSALEHRLTCE